MTLTPIQNPSPFFNRAEEYTRDIDPIRDYVQTQALYLSRRYGKPFDECVEFVKKTISKSGAHPVRDPEIKFLGKNEVGDLEHQRGTLMGYLNEEVRAGAIITPTLTSYVPEKVLPSKLLKKIGKNGKIRSKAKKAAFGHKAAKNMIGFNIENNRQTQVKRSSNAISGAQVTPSTPLFNPSGHSTLTSICRITAGYGNANNEVFLSGNRHYYTYELILNHFCAICRYIDRVAVKNVMEKYNLHIPSAQEVIELVESCTERYVCNREKLEKVKAFVLTLDDVDRVSVTYCGDFFRVRQYNEALVRSFMTDLSRKVGHSEMGDMGNPLDYIQKSNEEYVNLAHQICSDETMGIAKKYNEIRRPEDLHTLAWTIDNIDRVVTRHADLIRAFFVTELLPQAVASFHESVRDVVLIGDTDSTIFTVQEWVRWYFGDYRNGPNTVAITAAMCFLSASTVIHLLAKMSANLGISTERMFNVAMKSEFRFDVLVPTALGKHYWAIKGCQEGCVFVEHEIEEKGVNLISSAVPAYINEKAAEMRGMVTKAAWEGRKIRLADMIGFVESVEKHIIDSIRTGGTRYLRSGTIKDPASYSKTADFSPFQNHEAWEQVFAPKYGSVTPPPYVTYKINLTLSNPTEIRQWLAKMEDKELAQRLKDWYFTDRTVMGGQEERIKPARTSFQAFTIPSQALKSRGFPPEILEVIDYRQILSDICKALYIQLESLGWHCMRGRVRRFPSEQYMRSLGI